MASPSINAIVLAGNEHTTISIFGADGIATDQVVLPAGIVPTFSSDNTVVALDQATGLSFTARSTGQTGTTTVTATVTIDAAHASDAWPVGTYTGQIAIHVPAPVVTGLNLIPGAAAGN